MEEEVEGEDEEYGVKEEDNQASLGSLHLLAVHQSFGTCGFCNLHLHLHLYHCQYREVVAKAFHSSLPIRKC